MCVILPYVATRRLTTVLAAGLLLAACGSAGSSPSADNPTRLAAPPSDARLVAMVPSSIREDGRLSIGTDPSYPPMEFIGDGDTTVQGADIDLATGIAAVLRLDPEFVQEGFTAIPMAVRTGRFELGIAALTLPGDQTPRTNAVVYYESGSQLIRSPDVPKLAPANMCGYRVAVVEGSAQVRQLTRINERCHRKGLDLIDIQAFSGQQQGTEAVIGGGADGFLTDSPAAQSAVARDPRKLEAAGPMFGRAPLGMLTAPEFRRFTRVVKLALQQLIDTGYYQQVLDKWHIPEGAVHTARIRWAGHPTRPVRASRR